MPGPVPQPLPGETLFAYRVRRGWRRATHMAQQCGGPSMQPVISRMERGQRWTPTPTERVARLLGITVEQLNELIDNTLKVSRKTAP